MNPDSLVNVAVGSVTILFAFGLIMLVCWLCDDSNAGEES